MTDTQENTDRGYQAPLMIGGAEAVAIVKRGDGELLVALANGAVATVPAGTDGFAKAAALPDAAALPVSVPQAVSNAQARAALRAAGLIATVEAAIAAGGNAAIHDAWEYSPYIERNSALVQALAQQLGLTAAQVDALFIAAAKVDF
jgi:hypothetical protein